ncbi:hypothetical protein FF1_013510 [Malus domestica]
MAVPLLHQNDDASTDIHASTPLRYLSLNHVYSATSPCVSASGSSNVMSKKVKARKLDDFDDGDAGDQNLQKPSPKPSLVNVYSRRVKRPRHCSSFFDALLARNEPAAVKIEAVDDVDGEFERISETKKKRNLGFNELLKLGIDSSILSNLEGPRLRDSRSNPKLDGSKKGEKLGLNKRNSSSNCEKILSDSPSVKKWVGLSFKDVDPKTFIGLECKASSLSIGHWMLIGIRVALWVTTLTLIDIILNMKMLMRRICFYQARESNFISLEKKWKV